MRVYCAIIVFKNDSTRLLRAEPIVYNNYYILCVKPCVLMNRLIIYVTTFAKIRLSNIISLETFKFDFLIIHVPNLKDFIL